ncbi:GreA/GreB family elongation factor (plasmid) [Pseudonocardia bannensis]|uniref:GreA/GreB family elongation factor n=1 Tax=Pseudonocardia bannensis TaxID=630973 RepID=UPI0028A694E5|nr:GreA/GreB family elongation factor [Pseudonocardia bannensis]
MTDTPRVWLTPAAYERLKIELSGLLAQRSGQGMGGEPRPGGDQDRDTAGEQSILEDRDRDLRIRKLQEMMRNAVIGQEPPDDGIAEPGMVLTVRYADEASTETFLLADREPGSDGDIEVCSPSSPLGTALSGAKQGEQRRFQLPNGQMMTVSLVRAVPYTTSSSPDR